LRGALQAFCIVIKTSPEKSDDIYLKPDCYSKLIKKIIPVKVDVDLPNIYKASWLGEK